MRSSLFVGGSCFGQFLINNDYYSLLIAGCMVAFLEASIEPVT
jgi:hypothetical protein